MIGFFDAWKKTAIRAVLMLLFFNVCWEVFEVWLSISGLEVFGWEPFDGKWFWDTITDILVTIGAGMNWFYFTEYLKRKK